MATERSFRDIVLHELQLPVEILDTFEGANIDSDRLSRIPRDELEDVLTVAGTTASENIAWNIDEIFRRIVEWRQESGFGIIGFEDVEIVEDWLACDNSEETETNTVEPRDSSAASEQKSTEQITADTEVCRETEPSPKIPDPSIDSKVDSATSAAVPVPTLHRKTTTSDDLPSSLPGTSRAAAAGVRFFSPASTGKENRNFTPDVLVQLLEQTIVGRQLIERAASGPLSSESQRELVDIIAEYHCASGIKATEYVLREYAESITTVFKDETQDTYLVIRGGTKRNPGGKIYYRISNRKQKAAKRKRIEEKHQTETQKQAGKQPVDDPTVKEAEYWLEHNSQPWETTLNKWKDSFPARKPLLMKSNAVEEVLKRFRHYSNEFGFQLVDKDFDLLAKGDKNGSRTWDLCLEKLIRFVKRPYKDTFSSDIVEQLVSSELDQNSKVCAILILLNNILLPTKVTKTFKPTILSAQEDVIFFAASDAEAIQKVNEYNETVCKLGLKPSPKLVFRGESFKTLTGVFEVHYQNIVYRLDSAVRAIDVLIKFSTVFGLEHSRISRLVWNFVSSYMYKLPVPEEYGSIIKLKRYLSAD
ncbi:AAEL013428-PA [Aedes aegypti]|uniref:AAEL013428-PA n=1 Tax=Aedes aegypti TaxID=7159 RepID=Q16J68_AEDAE|nr:AAEL013428-PA [Aedes aegypti]